MKKLKKKAVKLVREYGVAVVFTACGEHKVVHSEKDIDVVFRLARIGAIAKITEVTK